MKKINIKQPKYMLPAILYIPLLVTGYLFIDMFGTGTAEAGNPHLQTVDSLNEDIPQPDSSSIRSKEENMEDYFGKAQDSTAMSNIEQDTAVDKENRYHSRYSSSDLRDIDRSQDAELRNLRRMQARGGGGYVSPLSERERRNYARQSNKDDMAEIEQALAKARRQGRRDSGSEDMDDPMEDKTSQTAGSSHEGVDVPDGDNGAAVSSSSAEDKRSGKTALVKKVKTSSDYFNTISDHQGETSLIRAIVDENIKAGEGSRIRLRLLDDIEVDGSLLTKGTYLYAQLSGFGQQRVKGKIESVLVNDEITKISLSIYDMDGLEGFYVPQSQFRETAKDVGSSAFNGGTNMMGGGSSTGNSLGQWAGQAVQNAYQRTTSAISKAIKRNHVLIKYGTQVYLVNGSRDKK